MAGKTAEAAPEILEGTAVPDPDAAVAVAVPQAVFKPYSSLANESWAEANENALEFPGYDLLTEERTDALENVPFLIVGVTYRPGIVTPDGRAMSYVSLECRVAPDEIIRRKGIDPGTLPFDGDAHVVFNDGSTGVYRQITEALEGLGWIMLGENGTRDNAPKGESVFDQPPGEWADIRVGDLHLDEDGRGIYHAAPRIRAPRGLRLSTYENDLTAGEATTRYIA
jgi:hypothetical protein